MKSISLITLIALLSFSCGSSKTSATPAEMEALKALVEQKSFEIESDWANPMATNAMLSLQNAGFFPVGSSAGSVSLLSSPNYLRVKGDSVYADLPYFGEAQMISYATNDSGINFKDLMADYELSKNEKNQSYELKFKADGKHESYNVFITLFPNGRSSMHINGTKRNSIEYTGKVSKLGQKKIE